MTAYILWLIDEMKKTPISWFSSENEWDLKEVEDYEANFCPQKYQGYPILKYHNLDSLKSLII
jgi:hypothetical protein